MLPNNANDAQNFKRTNLDVTKLRFRVLVCYRPQRSWGKVIFSQACVILFTGGILPQCMLGYHTPQTRHPTGSRHSPKPGPPGAGPSEQAPPRSGTPPGSRHPPAAEHVGRYGQRAGGTHPTGMQSC